MKIPKIVLKIAHPEVTYHISHILMKYGVLTLHPSLRDVKEICRYGTFKILGVNIKLPIGTGAGLDKNGDLIPIFEKLCGFHVVGSVTLRPRKGNRHPRLYRYVDYNAMINAMGLPSIGLRNVLNKVSNRKITIPIILNIAGFSIEEFVSMCKIINNIETIKIIELNISCPQYRNYDLHSPERLEVLLERVHEVCRKPILVKIRPRNVDIIKIVRICEKFSNVGLTISNSFPTVTSCMSSGIGGFSGLPLYKLVRKIIETVRSLSDIEIVACGGIFYGYQVRELIRRYRVSAVQIVTAIAFEGPYALVRIINEFC